MASHEGNGTRDGVIERIDEIYPYVRSRVSARVSGNALRTHGCSTLTRQKQIDHQGLSEMTLRGVKDVKERKDAARHEREQ